MLVFESKKKVANYFEIEIIVVMKIDEEGTKKGKRKKTYEHSRRSDQD